MSGHHDQDRPRRRVARSLRLVVATMLALVMSALVSTVSPPAAQAASYSDSWLSQYVEIPSISGATEPMTLVVQESTPTGQVAAKIRSGSLRVWWPGALKNQALVYEGSMPAQPVVVTRTLQRLYDEPGDGVSLVRWHEIESHADEALFTDAQYRYGTPFRFPGLTFGTEIQAGSAAPSIYRVVYRVDWIDPQSYEVAASLTVRPTADAEAKCVGVLPVSCWATGGHVLVG